MDLAEFKAQNEAEEQAATAAGPVEADEAETENIDNNDIQIYNSDNQNNIETSQDSEGEGEGESQEIIEPWQQTDDSDTVPVAVHRDTRAKLKGRISERDDEIASLKAEIEELKNSRSVTNEPASQSLKRPRQYDYDTDEEYEAALSEYEQKNISSRFDAIERKRQAEAQQRQAYEKLTKAVDAHYERAQKLIADSGIEPEVYKNTDMTVRRAIENVRPREGDIITDQLIEIIGDGSEKVLYYLGRNKPALNQFLVLMNEDPAGIKAAAFLGETKARLVTPQKQTSKARPPATKIKGDAPIGGNAKRLLKKYQDAHKKGDIQTAYNLKKEAKAEKIDVSKW